jgi:hypothetical protein
MPYKPYESDGLNLVELIKDTGSSPAPDLQSEFKANLVKALWNLRRLAVAGSGDMLESVYDPGGIASSAFDMANMIESATEKILTSAERLKLAGLEAPETGYAPLALTAGDAVYMDQDSNEWYKAGTSITGIANCRFGIAAEDIAGGGTGDIIVNGIYTLSGATSLSRGDPIYLGSVPGSWDGVFPPTTDTQLMLGWYMGSNKFYIDPKLVNAPNQNFDNRVSTAEIQTGTETEVRTFSPADVAEYFNRWDDIRVGLTSVKTGGSSDPDFAKLRDNGAGSQGVFTYLFSPLLEEEVYFEVQIPHSYKAGTDLKAHIHWCPIDANAGNVVWALEYTIANANQVIGNTTPVQATIAANGVAYKEQLDAIATISGAGVTESSLIIGRLYRKAADAADTYASDAAALSFDFHFQTDKLGSVNEIPS